MYAKRFAIFILFVLVACVMSIAQADDGPMFRKNISKTPNQETDGANINHMTFYVPAQNAAGWPVTLKYYHKEPDEDGNDILYQERNFAKPLVAVYIDALPEAEEGEEESLYGIMSGGVGLGEHDAYAAVSLDDGATWKRENLSNSAHQTSFTLADGTPFPGDVQRIAFAIAGDKVLVGWTSRYCDGGSPNYTTAITNSTWLSDTFGLGPLYLTDLFGVTGSQKSVNYTLQGFPEVGEIPYACVWAARGTLLPVTKEVITGTTPITVTLEGYDIVWTKAERLTSGRRDANRLEIAGDEAAGFMMVWQEDPDGLRPGQGLGPGEGWSGAVVNGQTDLWYSYISIENFGYVWADRDEEDYVDVSEYDDETIPKPAVPMAMPIRLTDNAMCRVGGQNALPYCFIDFDDVDDDGNLILPNPLPTEPLPNHASTFCADTVEWTNPGGTTHEICIARDGRVMQGRVGASRPRVNVQPYASTTLGVYDSAWVILGAEESKALGDGAPDDTGGGQPDEDEPPDIGKNMWYYSFDLLNPGFVMQGGMLNQPAQCSPYDILEGKDCELGEFMMLEDDLYEGNEFYETEISRRFAHMTQPIHQIGDSGVSSVLIIKQGILNQGGPADILLRFTQTPDDAWVDCPAGSEHARCLPVGYNPYAYENMICGEAEFDDDENQISGWAFQGTRVITYTSGVTDTVPINPRYLQGLCLSTPVNISGTSIVACDHNENYDCTDDFPWEGAQQGGDFPKVTRWSQCGPDYDGEWTACDESESTLDDQVWANPYDVAKGHRGFIDGDFIMIMYAWSPNWKANSVGNDKYNLYVRRSFDGGQTWTTTPEEFGGEGVVGDEETNPVACENYGHGNNFETVCFNYAAGEFEQARNVSQLIGNKETILDPRYTPTGGIKMLPVTDRLGLSTEAEPLPYPDDAVRDRSKFFIVYETGDNTTVSEGEAEPLDLFYSRATNWGDDYYLIEYPTGTGGGSGETSWGFPWLENKPDDMSGEAANTCNPGGTFYYVIWNQWQEDEHENVSNSDAIFRRVMFYPDEVAAQMPPTPIILYMSHSGIVDVGRGGDLIFVGSGHAYGNTQIMAYEWTSDRQGLLSEEKSLSIPVGQLHTGWHSIRYRVRDGRGNWSRPYEQRLFVGYFNYIPVISRQ